MQDEHPLPPREVFFWNGTALNVYSVAFLVAAPFWTASMILRDNEGPILLLWFCVIGLMALSVFEKPLFSYDTATQIITTADGRTMALSQIEIIEMDARDIYIIPRSHGIEGIHLKHRAWVLSPRRQLLAAAKRYNWPLKDISTPFSRILYTLFP
jgi:hypothetical protein